MNWLGERMGTPSYTCNPFRCLSPETMQTAPAFMAHSRNLSSGRVGFNDVQVVVNNHEIDPLPGLEEIEQLPQLGLPRQTEA